MSYSLMHTNVADMRLYMFVKNISDGIEYNNPGDTINNETYSSMFGICRNKIELTMSVFYVLDIVTFHNSETNSILTPDYLATN